MMVRTKSKSVWDAEGNPTSISLYPIRTRSWNIDSFRAGLIGSIRAWLPSRRSVESHRGALVMTRDGQVRSGRSTGVHGLYLWIGMVVWRCALADAEKF